jgi:DNA-binding sugar fermentation-stimulating protein
MISKGEKKVINILRKEHITFEKEKTFSNLQHNGVNYRFDFYLPYVESGPCLIEVDGAQHFQAA